MAGMNPEQWAKLSPLLDELLELGKAQQQERLAQIEANDAELAKALSKMLDADDTRLDFMSQPVFENASLIPRSGQDIGPYRLLELLGEGGMGQVWLAVRSDGLFERRVALKLLRSGLGGDSLHQRFARERQILARLAHPYIARLLDAGVSTSGQPYLALEYVRGEPITSYVQQQQLDLRARIKLFQKVCEAVSHAHANLVVHRDLKPSNIMVTPQGEVCLLDFGIAKLLDQNPLFSLEITRTGTRALTLHYGAPEQFRNEAVSTMTDVYSLGMVLFELLTTRRAFEPKRDTDAAWEEAVLSAEPLLASAAVQLQEKATGALYQARLAKALRGDIDVILQKALSRNPADRYSSVEAFARDLRRYLEGQPIFARKQSAAYRLQKFFRRHAVAITGFTVITGLLSTALLIVSWQARKATLEAERSAAMKNFVIGLFDATDSRNGNVQSQDLLGAGEQRADTELRNQPQERAELLGLIAQLRSQLGEHDKAIALLDKQNEALKQASSPPPDIALLGAATRAQSLRALKQPARCVEQLREFETRAQRADEAFNHARALFYAGYGRCYMELSKLSDAQRYFDLAIPLLQEDKPALARVQADQALVLSEKNLAGPAANQARQALDVLRANGGERNREGIEIWRIMAGIYAKQGNLSESEAAYRQAMDIAQDRLSPNHPLSAQLQLELADTLFAQSQWQDADSEYSIWLQREQRNANPDIDERVMLRRGLIAHELLRDKEAQQIFSGIIENNEQNNRDPNRITAACTLVESHLQAREWTAAIDSAKLCQSMAVGVQASTLQLYLAEAEWNSGARDSAISRWQGLRNTQLWPQAEIALLAGEQPPALGEFIQRAEALRQRIQKEKQAKTQEWELDAIIAQQQCRQNQLEAGRLRMQAVQQQMAQQSPRLNKRIRDQAGACYSK